MKIFIYYGAGLLGLFVSGLLFVEAFKLLTQIMYYKIAYIPFSLFLVILDGFVASLLIISSIKTLRHTKVLTG
jgi:hypothetical protein